MPQVGDLRQHAGREVLHAVQRHQLGAGVDDLVRPRRLSLILRICSYERMAAVTVVNSLMRVSSGLGLVVVDVEIADGVDFGA
jgi:hypothetical protein